MDADSRFLKFSEFAGLKFPLSEEKLTELVQSLRKRGDLPRVPRPEIPRFSSNVNPNIRFRLHPIFDPRQKFKLFIPFRHKAIQHFIEAFEYNFTGENFFNVKVFSLLIAKRGFMVLMNGYRG